MDLITDGLKRIEGLVYCRMIVNCCVPVWFRAVLERAKMLINMKHGMARLDNVWGVGGGQRPVMFLISKVGGVPTWTHTIASPISSLRCLCKKSRAFRL